MKYKFSESESKKDELVNSEINLVPHLIYFGTFFTEKVKYKFSK